jgi:hypothetical protein
MTRRRRVGRELVAAAKRYGARIESSRYGRGIAN